MSDDSTISPDALSDDLDDSPLELMCDGEEAAPLRGPNEHIDRSSILQVYLAFFGDVEKTAATLGIEVERVEKLATGENWSRKVESLRKLRQDKGADALARELNRTANFVQAIRLRKLLDRVIRKVSRGRNFEDFVNQHGRNASNISLKAPLELVKACQVVQDMSYAALLDTKGERSKEGSSESADSASLSVLRALTAGASEPTKTVIDITP